MKRLTFPSPYTVLLAVIVLSAAATWLLPAGAYQQLRYDEEAAAFVLETEDGEQALPGTQQTLDELGVQIPLEKFEGGAIRRPVAVPGTYTRLEASRQGLMAIARAPILGIYDAIDVVLFVLIIGGFIEVFNRSGAFTAGIRSLTNRLEGREAWLIIILTSLFALGGTIYGMAEETIAFYPLLVPIFIAAGYDLMVPLAVIYVGAGMGFMASTTNPFATIIASDAAGINWTEGLYGRVAMLIIGTTLCIGYIIRYGKRVKSGQAASLADADEQGGEVPALAVAGEIEADIGATERADASAALAAADAAPPDTSRARVGTSALSTRMRFLLVVFGLTFVVMVVGVSRLGWWFPEMTVLFLAAAVLVGVIAGGGEKRFVHTFVTGAERLLGVSFIIGIARGVTIVLDDGRISATMLEMSANLVSGMPHAPFIIGLMLVFFVLAFFISSSSGMAVLTMPIMGALGAMVGVSGAHVVNAYLFGFGLMQFITPTGLILPSLAMVNVSYAAWLRFFTPLLIILGLLSAVFLTVGVAL